MQQELLIAIMAGLGGMLGWGLADLFAKKTIDEVGDTVSLAWGHIFGTLAFVGIVLYQVIGKGQSAVLPAGAGEWGLIAFFGALQGLVYWLVYRGFGKGQVAVLNPVFASFSGLTALISILVFGETVGGTVLAALVTIFVGVLLINLDLAALRSRRRIAFTRVPGFKEVAAATVLAAGWTLAWDRFIELKSGLMYAFLMYAAMTAFILVIARIQGVSLRIGKPAMWKFLVLIGICEAIAYWAISVGYSATTQTSVIALLSGAFSLPTILLARVFLKERVMRIQTIGSLIIILGIVLLSVL